MSDLARPESGDPVQRMPNPAELYPRSAAPPQPAAAREPLPPQGVERTLQPVPAARAPQPRPVKRSSGTQQPSGFQRAMDLVRIAMPLVQKLLPLVEGNVASAVSNVLAPRPQAPHPVNLEPIEDALVKMHLEHREMRSQLEQQNSSLQRVADQLDKVKEATDRNTLEQQELMDDLHRMRKKLMVYAWVGLGLLGAAIAANVIVFLRTQRILP
ncbi:MAG: hypothetical protein KGM96_11525 [Acidobacteriota bacterium]|nr:hypothetical protein [Acidobacteriota bacterium]